VFRPEPTDADPRICYCMKVHRSTLLRAIAAGAATVADLQERTRAGTGCGTCRFDLLQLLAEASHARETKS
jgi:NAD(P)H-nitrite reductase large subunit